MPTASAYPDGQFVDTGTDETDVLEEDVVELLVRDEVEDEREDDVVDELEIVLLVLDEVRVLLAMELDVRDEVMLGAGV